MSAKLCLTQELWISLLYRVGLVGLQKNIGLLSAVEIGVKVVQQAQ